MDKKVCSIGYRWFLVAVLLCTVFANQCCNENLNQHPRYRQIKKNSRSTETILSQKYMSSLEDCQNFAGNKKALAFNFREKSRMTETNRSDADEFNCQVLACPEINSFASLVEDQNFDYYSMYSRKMMPANESVNCLASVGIFVIYGNPENFTNAQLACEKIGGKLAHIVSEERNEGLGKFTLGKPTFVGLSNRGKSRGWKNELGESLNCFNYRGWAEGEPSARGCVVLIPSESLGYVLSTWKVIPCQQASPFICEILPKFKIKRTKNSGSIQIRLR